MLCGFGNLKTLEFAKVRKWIVIKINSMVKILRHEVALSPYRKKIINDDNQQINMMQLKDYIFHDSLLLH